MKVRMIFAEEVGAEVWRPGEVHEATAEQAEEWIPAGRAEPAEPVRAEEPAPSSEEPKEAPEDEAPKRRPRRKRA